MHPPANLPDVSTDEAVDFPPEVLRLLHLYQNRYHRLLPDLLLLDFVPLYLPHPAVYSLDFLPDSLQKLPYFPYFPYPPYLPYLSEYLP